MLRMILLLLMLCSLVVTNLSRANENNFIKRKDVQDFIQQMVKNYKFNKDELTKLFSEVKIRPQVIRHINKPLEKEAWKTYQMAFVNEWRISHGVQFWHKHESVLQRAEEIYGVPAAVIVATIGIETKYGQRTGDFRVIDSLSNIAFSDSPRASFFRKELQEFLLLAKEQHMDPLKVMGSYAGAIGIPQFMPSSYRHYAVNFSRSGKTDLIHDEIDVIGSVANYYNKHGWKKNEPVVEQVDIIGARYNFFIRGNKLTQPLLVGDLSKYGIVPKNKIPHQFEHAKVKMIELESHYNKEYWLGFQNFDVIRRYNISNLYAMAVYQLSFYISELKERMNNV